jgi:hypothetical protein
LTTGRAAGGVTRQQAADDGQERQTVKEEAPAVAHGGQQQPAQRRADDARAVEHHGAEGDGVGEVFAADHLHGEGLPGGRLKGVHEAQPDGQQDDVPHLSLVGER